MLELFGAAVMATAPLELRPSIEIEGTELRFAQVFESAVLPRALRLKVDPLVVAELSPWAASTRLAPQDLLDRARRQVPALGAYVLPERAAETVVVVPRQDSLIPRVDGARRSAVASVPCAIVLRPIAAGQALRAVDLEAAPCQGELASVRYDAAMRVVRSAEPLAEGALVRAPTGTTFAQNVPGDTVIYRIELGPVRVERSVRVALPTPEGGRLLARGPDHRIWMLTGGEGDQ